MVRIPLSPPHFTARSNNGYLPTWSVMIPVYNCSAFLPDTLKSVLINNIPEEEMQIEVIDDASTDADIEAIVKQIGKGRIKYHRQLENVGSLRNFETCINRSAGNLVHILHGDDRVKKGYYEKIAHLFHHYPDAGAAFCRFAYIDEKGHQLYLNPVESKKEEILKNWLLLIAKKQRIQYAAITVRRVVYEKLGGFYGLTYAEDWEMWVRIAKHYPVAYTPEILAEYRKHTESISGVKFLEGEYMFDLKAAMELIQAHLPIERRKQVLRKSKIFYSAYALKIANQHWNNLHDKKSVLANINEGLKMQKNIFNFFKAAKLYLKILLRWR
ncbi:MAG: glycosyltransferase [Ginsengibacter sp.]